GVRRRQVLAAGAPCRPGLRRPQPRLLVPAAGRVRGLSRSAWGPVRHGRGPTSFYAVARDTSVDLISAMTSEPTNRPRSTADSLVIAAVSSPPSTVIFTAAMTEPRTSPVIVPGNRLR